METEATSGATQFVIDNGLDVVLLLTPWDIAMMLAFLALILFAVYKGIKYFYMKYKLRKLESDLEIIREGGVI